MDKVVVFTSGESARVPFLRGILTRSLQNAGLSFEESYRVASAVRQQLADQREISTDELRKLVARHLDRFDPAIRSRYLRPTPVAPQITVGDDDGHGNPFSRGGCRQALECCGFSPEQASRIASEILDRLTAAQVGAITSRELRRLTHECIDRDLGADAAHRFLVWEEFRASKRPLLVLLGGTVGSGKSTISGKVAHLLDIVRTQSTDMLREVMRTMIPRRLLPVLHTSSFKAWQELPMTGRSTVDPHALLEDGYLTQVELVSVACEAVIQRALQERLSLVIEGVHVHPSLLDRLPDSGDAILVPVTLAVLKQSELRRRIRGRGKRVPDRRTKRYLEHFDSIWQVQSFLLAEADRLGVPIVPNVDQDSTVQQVMNTIYGALANHFAGDPDRLC